MIAYNTEWLKNLSVRAQADKAFQSHCISQQEKEQVYSAYPSGFYTPNIFVRIGLFTLTLIIALFSFALLLLFILSDIEKTIGGMAVFFGFLAYSALELMVKKKHFNSGVDDALLWISPISFVIGLNLIINISWLGNAIIIFILALYLLLRFTNMVMAAIICVALMAIVFLNIIKWGTFAKAAAPFIIMITAAFIYLIVERLLKRDQFKYYHNSLIMASITALVCFYLAGNFYVVREASVAMFSLELHEGETIPFGWLFWISTITIPLAYIARGVQKKNVVLLRVGLFLIAAMIFTVRYYYHLISIEAAAVTGGIIFICIAYVLIRYLKEPKHGFTCIKENDPDFMGKLQLESILIAQTFSGSVSPVDNGTQFGGGSGGGGGATGSY